MWTRKTLRKMPPVTRQLAKEIMVIDRAVYRLSHRLETYQRVEIEHIVDLQVAMATKELDAPKPLRCHGCGMVYTLKPSLVVAGYKCPCCTAPYLNWQVEEVFKQE